MRRWTASVCDLLQATSWLGAHLQARYVDNEAERAGEGGVENESLGALHLLAVSIHLRCCRDSSTHVIERFDEGLLAKLAEDADVRACPLGGRKGGALRISRG